MLKSLPYAPTPKPTSPNVQPPFQIARKHHARTVRRCGGAAVRRCGGAAVRRCVNSLREGFGARVEPRLVTGVGGGIFNPDLLSASIHVSGLRRKSLCQNHAAQTSNDIFHRSNGFFCGSNAPMRPSNDGVWGANGSTHPSSDSRQPASHSGWRSNESGQPSNAPASAPSSSVRWLNPPTASSSDRSPRSTAQTPSSNH